jgi:cytochrome c-type biogenesis protein CcmH
VALPLLRARASGEPAARGAAIGAVLLILGTAAALYAALTHWSWERAPDAGTPNTSVAQLLREVAGRPTDLPAWLQLGQAYLQLEQYPLALRAYERANRLAGGGSAEALSGMAEAVTLNNDNADTDRALELFNRALQLDPKSPKALFYTGLSALQAGNLTLARERFGTMLTLDAPENVHAALQKQIAALDAQIARTKPDAATAIHLQVKLAANFAASAPPDAALFVFVRNPQGGAPLAVKRLPATLPQQVEMSAADSMLETSKIRPGQRVDVIARISRSGVPTAQAGDLYGQIGYVAGQEGQRELLIDKQSR